MEAVLSKLIPVIVGFILAQAAAVTWALIKMFFDLKTIKARFNAYKIENDARLDNIEETHKQDMEKISAEHRLQMEKMSKEHKEQMVEINKEYKVLQEHLHKILVDVAVLKDNIQTLMLEKISSNQRERRQFSNK